MDRTTRRRATQKTTDKAPKRRDKQRAEAAGGGAPRTGRGGQTGRLAECAEEGYAHCTMAQGVVSWGHVKPTQRGEAKNHKRQAQHGVEGGAPHRAEAFVAIQYVDEEKKKANSISRPASNRQEVVQTGQTPRPLPKQPDIQTETNEGDPSEPLISTTKQATRPHTEANQPTKWGQGQARPTTRRPKTQKTQQTQKPQKTTTEATGKRKSHGIGPRESHQGNPYRGTKIEFAT